MKIGIIVISLIFYVHNETFACACCAELGTFEDAPYHDTAVLKNIVLPQENIQLLTSARYADSDLGRALSKVSFTTAGYKMSFGKESSRVSILLAGKNEESRITLTTSGPIRLLKSDIGSADNGALLLNQIVLSGRLSISGTLAEIFKKNKIQTTELTCRFILKSFGNNCLDPSNIHQFTLEIRPAKYQYVKIIGEKKNSEMQENFTK